MEAVSTSQTHSSNIQWKQLWSLAALYASVVIGWIAYQNYQPKLLVQFQFTDFTFLLAVAQGVILVITPPLAGRLGDRYRLKNGHRLPIITAGMSFAAMVFMAVAFTLLSSPGEIFKWVLPVLIVFWLISMSIFTSPALSTMELFTPADKLPSAMAVLTIAANLLYSLEPIIVDIIDYIGAPLTFISGGVVVAISGMALRKNSLNLFELTKNREEAINAQASAEKSRKSAYGFIFFLGTALGLGTTVMFNLFPELFQLKLGAVLENTNPKMVLVTILVISAFTSLPISTLVNRYGIARAFWVSLVLLLISLMALFTLPQVWIMFVMMGVFALAFTAMSVSALPLAISKANYYEKVLCVGIFFSGVAFPDGILQAIQAF
jgi:MFS family permease